MAFKQTILEDKVACPRCNAESQHRLEERENSPVISVVHVCDKCKLRKLIGVTSREAIELEVREKRLRSALEHTSNPYMRALIEARIRRVVGLKNAKLLGL